MRTRRDPDHDCAIWNILCDDSTRTYERTFPYLQIRKDAHITSNSGVIANTYASRNDRTTHEVNSIPYLTLMVNRGVCIHDTLISQRCI